MPRARDRADARWRVTVTIALAAAAVAVSTALYFAFLGAELVDPDGRTLDCGSLAQPVTTRLAAANCGGVNDSNVAPVIVCALVVVAAVVLIAVRLWRRSRRILW